MSTQLQQAIENYIENPKDSERNYALGRLYEQEGQLAAALTFYLRTAELTKDAHLQYECLIRNHLMIAHQTRRDYSANGQLLLAMALLPERPEAYFLFSRFYENKGEWQDVYAYVNIALAFQDKEMPKLRSYVGYDGIISLLYLKALAGWRIGRGDDARKIFRELLDKYALPTWMANKCLGHLNDIGGIVHQDTPYSSSDHDNLRIPFSGSENIIKNYSQAYQDMFALTVSEGKQKGKFVEIGSGDPFYRSNTALLEKEYDWRGACIEISPEQVEKFNEERSTRALNLDATIVDYKQLFEDTRVGYDIDYLHIDCSTPDVSYSVLKRIPFNEYRFRAITFKHDHYYDRTKSFRDKSRKYLQELGYKLLVADVSPDNNTSYEDWWVHPDLVSLELIMKMQKDDGEVTRAKDYMLEGL